MRFPARILAAFACAAAVAFVALPALADPSAPPGDEPAPRGIILAPTNALELELDVGYTQPFGSLTREAGFGDVAHAGFGSGGALAWRVSPRFAIAGYGSFHQSTPDASMHGGMVFGGAGGLEATVHFLPYRLADPYLTVGSGYRLLFEAPGGLADNHMLHGFEALKTNVGVDFRVTKSLAIGPMIGADMNVFVWDLDETRNVNVAIPDRGLSTFVFAGVGGRMDLLGRRVAPARSMAMASDPSTLGAVR